MFSQSEAQVGVYESLEISVTMGYDGFVDHDDVQIMTSSILSTSPLLGSCVALSPPLVICCGAALSRAELGATSSNFHFTMLSTTSSCTSTWSTPSEMQC